MRFLSRRLATDIAEGSEQGAGQPSSTFDASRISAPCLIPFAVTPVATVGG